MNELQLIERLRSRVPLSKGQLLLGIGDDCAIYRPKGSSHDLLFTTDLMVEGVHFHASAPPRHIGYKALARGLSDIAAMGGVPEFCLVSLALPSLRSVDAFYKGLLTLADRTGTALAGGDVARSRRLTVDIVVCGKVRRGRALRRDQAVPGDYLYVSGPLGRAASHNYRVLPEPRLAFGRKLIGQASACMDLSDGLSIDLRRLCSASGVGAELNSVPIFPGATLDQALHGGEDYELLFAANAPNVAGAICIGRIVNSAPGSVTLHGEPLPALGFDHFA